MTTNIKSSSRSTAQDGLPFPRIKDYLTDSDRLDGGRSTDWQVKSELPYLDLYSHVIEYVISLQMRYK